MTFEEFFQKKRISLTALQAGEPGLFAEFQLHFEQMGEKSFDHTKKYWFNKLRQTYHLAPEQKPAKMHLENQLAEQTIIETLTDTIPKPTVGFKPRFSATTGKPKGEVAEEKIKISAEPKAESEEPKADSIAIEPVAKPAGFKPRFNPKMLPPKPVEESLKTEDIVEQIAPQTPDQERQEDLALKPAGFKPRFNAKMTASKPSEIKADEPVQSGIEESTRDVTAEEEAPKPAGFKPRFNMKMVVPKVEQEVKDEETSSSNSVAEKADEPSAKAATEPEPASESTVTKPAGFKPRFNAKAIKPKPPEEQ